MWDPMEGWGEEAEEKKKKRGRKGRKKPIYVSPIVQTSIKILDKGA